MWLVVLAFALPAALFSLCGAMAWVKMHYIGRRREQKVFDELEEQIKRRIEEHKKNIVSEELSYYGYGPSSGPAITINEPEESQQLQPRFLPV